MSAAKRDMTSAVTRGRRSSFVVRVAADRRGQLSGVIERVATGAKEAFGDQDAIGRVIATMLRDERSRARARAATRSPDERSHLPVRPRTGSSRGARG